MKIPLLIIITLIFFILITGCVTQPPSKSNLTATLETDKITASQTPVFPGEPNYQPDNSNRPDRKDFGHLSGPGRLLGDLVYG